MLTILCSNITPCLGVDFVAGSMWRLATEMIRSVPGCVTSPHLHGGWLSIHVNGIKKTADGE